MPVYRANDRNGKHFIEFYVVPVILSQSKINSELVDCKRKQNQIKPPNTKLQKIFNHEQYTAIQIVHSISLLFESFRFHFHFDTGSYHLITNSPTKSILSNSQHSTPQRTVGSDHPLNQQQSKMPMGSPHKGYMMLPYRKINDSPTHQLIQIQHSNLDNYCRKYIYSSIYSIIGSARSNNFDGWVVVFFLLLSHSIVFSKSS